MSREIADLIAFRKRIVKHFDGDPKWQSKTESDTIFTYGSEGLEINIWGEYSKLAKELRNEDIPIETIGKWMMERVEEVFYKEFRDNHYTLTFVWDTNDVIIKSF